MNKYIRILLVIVVSLAVLGMAGRYFIGWSLSGAFQPAMKESGGFRQLTDVVEASVGSTLTRGDARLQPGEAAGQDTLAYYQRHSKRCNVIKNTSRLGTLPWLLLTQSVRVEQKQGRWESSTAASWIAPSQKIDAWRHTFCVQSDPQKTIVVSPGPQALRSLDCNSLKIAGEEVAQLPQVRLIRTLLEP